MYDEKPSFRGLFQIKIIFNINQINFMRICADIDS